MAIVTATANRVTLNNGADVYFEGEHVFAPLGCYSAKALPEVLNRIGADVIEVEYRTISDPKARARDEKKFSKRLAQMGDGWMVSAWTNKVVKGFVFEDTMVCRMERTGK